MDLAAYVRALAASRGIVIGGVVLAIALSVLAYAKPTVDSDGMPTLVYRKAELWQAQTALLLTQKGFPEGRSTFPSVSPKQYPYADPGRFYSLTDLYAQLVMGDKVQKLVRASGPMNGTVLASPIPSSTGGQTPLIAIFGKTETPSGASALAQRTTRAFLRYLASRQSAADIPAGQRVEVQQIRSPSAPILLEPRSKTLPIMVFLAVFSASVAFAFVRQNVRTRAPAVPMPAPEPAEEPAPPGRIVTRVQPRKTQTLR
jgi:hypothetical protein